jgi:hypothetical protein
MRKHIGVQLTGLQSSDLAQPSIVDVATSPVETIDDHSVKFAAVVQGAVPDVLASVTNGQPGPSEADKILPSAAAFRDASVDPLHHGLVPLALLGQEGKNGTLVVGAEHAAPHQLAAVGSAPGVSVPPPGGPATLVFEAGLGARNGEPPGTHAGQPSFPVTTKTGTINFTRFHRVGERITSKSLGHTPLLRASCVRMTRVVSVVNRLNEGLDTSLESVSRFSVHSERADKKNL